MRRAFAICLTLMVLCGGNAWGESASIFQRFSSKIESKYFVFYSDLPRQTLQRYVEFSNLFLDVVDRDFVRLRNFKRLDAVVTSNQSDMLRFLSQQLGRNEPPLFGIYLPENNLFVTYNGSGLGTFAHEIMHPVIESELPHVPSWGREGIPAFFEKFYGYKEGNRLYLKWGYQNPWRIRALGERLLRLKLGDIMRASNDQSELRLVSVFLYQRGKLRSFFELIRNGDKKGYGSYVEAVFNTKLLDIEAEWQKYLTDTYDRRRQIYELPASYYVESKQEFLEFERRIRSPLVR